MNAFDAVNFDTPDGQKLKGMLLSRLEELRKQNDDVEMGERQTAVTRGAIQEIKKLLGGAPPVTKLPSYSFPHTRDRG